MASSAIIIARPLAAVPPFQTLAVILNLGGMGLKGYAGYLCHTTDRLLYGFLVQEGGTLGGVTENLLKGPPIFPL